MAGQVLWPNGSLQIPRVTSEFGMRFHPIDNVWRLHAGIDLVGWSTIIAPASGTVTFAGYNGGAGNEVRIREDGTGDVYRLLHNRELWVRTGQWVAQGAGVAVMGTTGSSTGVHCHFETHPGGGSPINPRDFMARRNAVTPPTPQPTPDEDEYMNTVIYWQRATDGLQIYALINTESGYLSLWSGSDTAYNNRMAAAFRTGNFVPVTESHANNLMNSAKAVARPNTVSVDVTRVDPKEVSVG